MQSFTDFPTGECGGPWPRKMEKKKIERENGFLPLSLQKKDERGRNLNYKYHQIISIMISINQKHMYIAK